MDKLLIVGSGPQAANAKKMNLNAFNVICLNNAWAAVPLIHIDLWYHSSDFKMYAKHIPDEKIAKILEKRGWTWRSRLIDNGYWFDVSNPARESTVFLDVMSPVMQTLEIEKRWNKIYFLGLDHDYRGEKTHFYGKSTAMSAKTKKLLEKNAPELSSVAADPLRFGEERLLIHFRKIKEGAAAAGVKLVVLSDNKHSPLWRGFFQ